MKIGDVIINPYVSELYENGMPNPIHKTMVIRIGNEYTSVLRIDGKITYFYTKECKDWKISHHINWIVNHDAAVRADAIEEELQGFAQWLWDNHYLVDEAFTIRLVEQYKQAQLKEQKE